MHESDKVREQYDVVIVGAGMVGATLACALEQADSGLRVLLLEATALQGAVPAQPGFDARSTALSAGTVAAFDKLGLWPSLAEEAAPIHSIHVSDQGRFATTRLEAADYGLEALGQVVENRLLGQALNAALRNAQALQVRERCRLLAATPVAEGYTLQLAENPQAGAEIHSEVTTRLLVLAEGGRSDIADRLGLYRHVRPYDQTAIITNLSIERPHQQVAYERFTEQGPLALLPLRPFAGEQRCALVWTRATEAAQALMLMDDREFVAQLQRDVGYRLGAIRHAGERQCYPLSLIEAEEQYRAGLVLLGNLAHTLHPVAGQGFNLAMRAALALADTILAAQAEGQSPGAPERLAAYARRIRGDQQSTILFSDAVTRLFASKLGSSRLARQLGLLGMDVLPLAQRQFARRAMGLAGRSAGLH